MKKLHFKTRSRVIRTLGDRLVSDENAAIIELVKNSYDADASFCKVKIDPIKGIITVEDDGHGMTVDDVVSKWAELGTENKSNNRVSPSGRKLLGEKGIGRLATAKLGNKLEILSTSSKDAKLSTIKLGGIDWSLFLENEEDYLENVEFYYQELEAKDRVGTLLTISELQTKWSKEKLEKLISELRKLMSPLAESDESFKIYLDLNAFNVAQNDFDGSELVNGRNDLFENLQDKSASEQNLITPFPILDACDYKFYGEFDGSYIKGKFYISDEQKEYPIDINLDDDVSCGFGVVRLHIFDRDADSVRNTFVQAGLYRKDQKSIIPLREARRAIDDLSGIAVYRDNFRIRPYGDPEADWLLLDKRRVQNPSLRLEQAQVSGIVLVEGQKESGLIERSSREGFEHNDHYAQFKKIMLAIFAAIEPLRFAYKDKTGKNRVSEKDKAKYLFKRLHEQVTFKDIEEISSELPEKEAEKLTLAIDQQKTRLEDLIKSLEQRQELLEARSTLGFIISEVIHEARHPTSAIGASLISLKKRVNKAWDSSIHGSVQKELTHEFDENLGHVSSLQELYKRMDPFLRMRRKKPQEYNLVQSVDKSLLLFKDKIKKTKIQIKHNTDQQILVHGVEEDIITAITNIIDNAIYWLSHRKIEKPYIFISYEINDEEITLKIEDNAGGVSDDYKESIFNVGFSAKENGTGLGLSIARESLGRANAQIYHSNTNDGSAFVIEIYKDT